MSWLAEFSRSPCEVHRVSSSSSTSRMTYKTMHGVFAKEAGALVLAQSIYRLMVFSIVIRGEKRSHKTLNLVARLVTVSFSVHVLYRYGPNNTWASSCAEKDGAAYLRSSCFMTTVAKSIINNEPEHTWIVARYRGKVYSITVTRDYSLDLLFFFYKNWLKLNDKMSIGMQTRRSKLQNLNARFDALLSCTASLFAGWNFHRLT